MDLKDRIFATPNAPHYNYDVKEWDVTVGIREFTSVDKYELHRVGKTDDDGNIGDYGAFCAYILHAGLVDPETGKRMFTVDEAAQLIDDKEPDVIDALVDKIMAANDTSEDALEQAEKN